MEAMHGFFEMLLSRLNTAPESALMVGDSLKSDIQGAHAVGMKAAWVNRPGKVPDDSIIPDFVVSDLEELSIVLQNSVRGSI
jgi:FMN phosphatase YigB (HAD superfamily)